MYLSMKKAWLPTLLGIAAGGVIASSMKHCSAKAKARRKEEKELDVTSEDSFPASDPPSWTSVHSLGAPHASQS